MKKHKKQKNSTFFHEKVNRKQKNSTFFHEKVKNGKQKKRTFFHEKRKIAKTGIIFFDFCHKNKKHQNSEIENSTNNNCMIMLLFVLLLKC